jgi:hypothetical protein
VLDRQGVALQELEQRRQAERAQQSASVSAGGVLDVGGDESVRVAIDVGSVESTGLPAASSVAVPMPAGSTPDVFCVGAATVSVGSATPDSTGAVSVFSPGEAATFVAAATGAGGGTTHARTVRTENFVAATLGRHSLCHRRSMRWALVWIGTILSAGLRRRARRRPPRLRRSMPRGADKAAQTR